ncbi:MAG: glycosyltransferase family 2 protein [Lachnospiraceae bacterium]|nr:glycosyltransferase family 2 protein [Lachnospiraceae bacterium]
MKLISFGIPCYNSSGYMSKCIESILPGGDDIEIIIVDDGSTDDTGRIADEYAAKYPGIIKAVHQENGGHGMAVNTGLKNATGMYYKVVDSDDWLDSEAYPQVLSHLKKLAEEDTYVDMFIANYVYDKVDEDHHRRMSYKLLFPQEQVFTWSEMKRNITGLVILMHSVIYRRELLLECNLELPAHTFYVDNLFVYEPLPYVKTMYYLNVDLYRYYIGRDGQSVAEETMVKRIDQQLAVNYRMVDAYDLWSIEEEHLRKYMFSYLEMITIVSTSIAYVSKTEENYKKIKALWRYIKEKDVRTYRYLRHNVFGRTMTLPGKFGRAISLRAYRISQRIMGFN